MEVRFWRRGSTQAHTGFSIDVSRSGLFLGTTQQLEPGERLRLEFPDKENGFVIEGQVARIHRVSLALRHVEQPGVGIRFLQPAELVNQMIGSKPIKGSTTSSGANKVRYSASPSGETRIASSEGAGPASRASSELDDLFGPSAAPRAEAAADPVPAGGEGEGPARAESKPTAPTRTVPVEFVDRASFLSVYQRDIAAGGLFVSTSELAPLDDVVLIEIRPPIRGSGPFRFEARVVHRFDPPDGEKGKMAGLGVQFLDPDGVRRELEPVVAELRR